MDFIVDVAMTQGRYDSILVVADRITKMAHFIPIRTLVTALQVAYLFITHVFHLHGLPISILSNMDVILLLICLQHKVDMILSLWWLTI